MLDVLKRLSIKPIWLYITIIVITVLTFIRGVGNLFVAEDFHYLNDFSIAFPDFVHYLLYSSRVKLIGFGFQWILTQLFGIQPVGYHLVLIGLHVATVIVLSLLLTKLLKNVYLALLIGLVFAVYPRSHQAILWYAAIHFSMVTLAVLITVLAFLLYLETSKRRWQVIGWISFFAGLMIHESSIFAIPLLFLVDVLIIGHPEGIRSLLKPKFWLKYLPYIGLFMLYFVVNFTGLRSFRLSGGPAPVELISVGGTGENYGLKAISFSTLKDILSYLTYALFPNLPLRSLEVGSGASYVFVGLTILLLAVALFKGDRIVRFGVAWLVFTTLPFVLFVPFGNADRYFYLLAVGFAIIVGGAARMIYRKYSKVKVLVGFSIGFFILYLVSSVVLIQNRIGEWHEAGLIADDYIAQVVNLVPSPEPGSHFLFVNPPTTSGEAYIFLGGGMSGALPLRYNKTIADLQVFHSFDPNVIEKIQAAPSASVRLPNLYILLYADGKVIDKSNITLDVQSLNPQNWSKG